MRLPLCNRVSVIIDLLDVEGIQPRAMNDQELIEIESPYMIENVCIFSSFLSWKILINEFSNNATAITGSTRML